jgi:hypothetical protein
MSGRSVSNNLGMHPTKMAAPHEKENEPNRRLMDLFHHTSQMSQTSPGGAFRLLVMGLPDNPRHRIGGLLRIGRLSRMATCGHARRDPFFQLFASNGRCCFISVSAFLFWDLDSLEPEAVQAPQESGSFPLI